MVVATAHGPPKPHIESEADRVFSKEHWALGAQACVRSQFPKLIAALSEIEFL